MPGSQLIHKNNRLNSLLFYLIGTIELFSEQAGQ